MRSQLHRFNSVGALAVVAEQTATIAPDHASFGYNPGFGGGFGGPPPPVARSAPLDQQPQLARPQFCWQESSFRVQVLGTDVSLYNLPATRATSRAIPSHYVTGHELAETEDDVLHLQALPSFDDALPPPDAELLLSYLTVPYMRVPLVLSFFATDDRIHSLKSEALQNLLSDVLFEPGTFARVGDANAPELIPTPKKAQLASGYGLLLNEIHFSPTILLTSMQDLLSQALDLDTGIPETSTEDLILYVVRMVASLMNYINMVLNHHRGVHDNLSDLTVLRDVKLTEKVAKVRAMIGSMIALLFPASSKFTVCLVPRSRDQAYPRTTAQPGVWHADPVVREGLFEPLLPKWC